jgi:addiction module HigA family antidote
MLQEEFLTPLGLSHPHVANAIHVPAGDIAALVAEQARLTPSLALRLAKFFGTSPDFWLNLQLRWDVYQVQQAEQGELAAIEPLVRSA